jgi:hypothetical protein
MIPVIGKRRDESTPLAVAVLWATTTPRRVVLRAGRGRGRKTYCPHLFQFTALFTLELVGPLQILVLDHSSMLPVEALREQPLPGPFPQRAAGFRQAIAAVAAAAAAAVSVGEVAAQDRPLVRAAMVALGPAVRQLV